jgi:hypothetical protein
LGETDEIIILGSASPSPEADENGEDHNAKAPQPVEKG